MLQEKSSLSVLPTCPPPVLRVCPPACRAQIITASVIITVLSASMLKIAHMREKWERKLQVRWAVTTSTAVT